MDARRGRGVDRGRACAKSDTAKTDTDAAKTAGAPGKSKINIAMIAKASTNPVFLAGAHRR